MFDYSFIEIDKMFVTNNLEQSIGREFSVNKGEYTLDDIKSIFDYILNYRETTGNEIKDGEIFGYGIWLIKFVFNEVYIELHELKDVINDKNIFGPGLDLCITLNKSQIKLCEENGLNPSIPKLAQKIAVSKDIFNGSEVNGVRYDAPEHMSGWYLTSNSYNGDVNTLLVDSLFYLIKVRPDLVKFLALPSGYRFFKDNIGEDIWYDPD